MSAEVPVITSTPDEVRLARFQYHPKIVERLKQMLAIAENRRDTCDPRDAVAVAEARKEIQTIRTVFGLPEQIFEEEKKARG